MQSDLPNTDTHANQEWQERAMSSDIKYLKPSQVTKSGFYQFAWKGYRNHALSCFVIVEVEGDHRSIHFVYPKWSVVANPQSKIKFGVFAAGYEDLPLNLSVFSNDECVLRRLDHSGFHAKGHSEEFTKAIAFLNEDYDQLWNALFRNANEVKS